MRSDLWGRVGISLCVRGKSKRLCVRRPTNHKPILGPPLTHSGHSVPASHTPKLEHSKFTGTLDGTAPGQGPLPSSPPSRASATFVLAVPFKYTYQSWLQCQRRSFRPQSLSPSTASSPLLTLVTSSTQNGQSFHSLHRQKARRLSPKQPKI